MKFIHINTLEGFNSARFSAVSTNDSYFSGGNPGSISEGTPNVLYEDLAFCKATKVIYTHGALYEASDTDLSNYYTKGDVDSTFATKNELTTKQNKISGNLGEVVYHDGTDVFTQTIMCDGYVVDTTEDLNKCKNDTISVGSVLNTWKRFSILDGTSNARPAEIEAWTSSSNALTQPLDSESFVGVISPRAFSDYEVIIKCTSTGSDDATIGIVAAYAKDSSGKEHTLSFLRTPGGSSSSAKPKWAAVLDFNGTFESVAYNQAIIVDQSSTTTIPASTTNWNNPTIEEGTTIKVRRTGNTFTAYCSQFGSTTVDNSTVITINLDTYSVQYPLLKLFYGSAQWGYAAFSQPNTKFTNILVTDPNYRIYDLTTNSVLEFSSSSEAWAVVPNRTPMSEVGIGRFSYNKTTNKLFYNNGTEILEVSKSLGSDSGIVTDVKVNGTSVVSDGEANITVPTQVQANWNETNSASKAYIQNKPTIPPAQVQANWSETDTTSKAFIQNKPTIPAEQIQADWSEIDTTSKAYIQNKPSIPAEQVQADWNEVNTGSKAFILNKPAIPSEQVQANWNETNSTSKAFIQNKPSIPAAQVQSDWNEVNQNSKAFILNKPTIPVQVQSDWDETDATSKSFIQNKPTIPEQVQSDWNEADISSKAYIQHKPTIPPAQVQANWSETDINSKAFIQNKPTIPEQVQANWSETNTTSKSFIKNKPTIPPAQVQSNWDETDTTSKAYIQNKPTIPEQVQANWNETNSTSKAYIQNKPSIPAAQIQSDWNEVDTTSKAYIQNKPSIPAETTVTQVVSSGTEIAKVNGTSIYIPSAIAGLKQISNLDSYLNSAPSGEIVQYVGPTTQNYTHGYIYEKVGSSYTLPANVKRFQIKTSTTRAGETIDTTGWYILSGETYMRSEIMAGGARVWGYPLVINSSQLYNGDTIRDLSSYEISSDGTYINSHWVSVPVWENVLTGVKISTWYDYHNYTSDWDIKQHSVDSSVVIGSDGKLVSVSRVTDGILTVNPTSELTVYGPQSWVRIDVQPRTTIHFVDASSINHDMSNIDATGFVVNDLVVVTDLTSTLYYYFYYNSGIVNKSITGDPEIDVMFRYTGNGYKPISFPPIY